MKKKILHCNESYAKIGENYIFDQVNSNNSFEGLLVSEKYINSSYNPIHISKRVSLRKLFNITFHSIDDGDVDVANVSALTNGDLA